MECLAYNGPTTDYVLILNPIVSCSLPELSLDGQSRRPGTLCTQGKPSLVHIAIRIDDVKIGAVE